MWLNTLIKKVVVISSDIDFICKLKISQFIGHNTLEKQFTNNFVPFYPMDSLNKIVEM